MTVTPPIDAIPSPAAKRCSVSNAPAAEIANTDPAPVPPAIVVPSKMSPGARANPAIGFVPSPGANACSTVNPVPSGDAEGNAVAEARAKPAVCGGAVQPAIAALYERPETAECGGVAEHPGRRDAKNTAVAKESALEQRASKWYAVAEPGNAEKGTVGWSWGSPDRIVARSCQEGSK